MNQNLPTTEEIYSTYDKNNDLKKKFKPQCLTPQKNHTTLNYANEQINNKFIGIIKPGSESNVVGSIEFPPADVFIDASNILTMLVVSLLHIPNVRGFKNNSKESPIITVPMASNNNDINNYIDSLINMTRDDLPAVHSISLADLFAPPNMTKLTNAINSWNTSCTAAGLGQYDNTPENLNFTPSDSPLNPIQIISLGSFDENFKLYNLEDFYPSVTYDSIPNQKIGYKRFAFPISITLKQQTALSMVVDSVTIKNNNTLTVLDPETKVVPEGVYYYNNILGSKTLTLEYLFVKLIANEVEENWKLYLHRLKDNQKTLTELKKFKGPVTLTQEQVNIISVAEYRKALFDMATAIINDTEITYSQFKKAQDDNDSGAFGIVPFNSKLKKQVAPLDLDEEYSKKINTLKTTTLKNNLINLQNLVDTIHQDGPLIKNEYNGSDFNYKEIPGCDKCYTYSINNIFTNHHTFSFFTNEDLGLTRTIGTYYCPSHLGDDKFTQKELILQSNKPDTINPPYFDNMVIDSSFFITSVSVGAGDKYTIFFEDSPSLSNNYLLNIGPISTPTKKQSIIPLLPSQMITFTNSMDPKCGTFIFEYLYKTLKINPKIKEENLSEKISKELVKLEKIIEKLKPETEITSQLCAPIIAEYRNKLDSFIELYSTMYPEGTGPDTSPWYEIAKYTIKPHDGTQYKDRKGKPMVHLEINKIPINKPYVG